MVGLAPCVEDIGVVGVEEVRQGECRLFSCRHPLDGRESPLYIIGVVRIILVQQSKRGVTDKCAPKSRSRCLPSRIEAVPGSKLPICVAIVLG
jgi:hypothetical protein